MTALRLRFPNRQQPDLVLGPGVHAIGRDIVDRPVMVADPDEAIAQFCVDRRGVWLKVREPTQGLYVNGRPVRRMAMLRAGDAVFVDGNQWLLLGDTPPSAPPESRQADDTGGDPRTVLRGVGGPHHGRSITLDQPRVVGRLSECDIRIDDAAFADRHARLEPHAEGVVLRDLGSHEGSVVNGWPVRNALLRAGDQVVFDTQRFIVEAPNRGGANESRKPAQPAPVAEVPVLAEPARLPSSARRMPWLLLAALFLAGALSLLLLYGAR
ncbi:FHA domain-containing protein [Lysobacter tyrosinilyticus]